MWGGATYLFRYAEIIAVIHPTARTPIAATRMISFISRIYLAVAGLDGAAFGASGFTSHTIFPPDPSFGVAFGPQSAITLDLAASSAACACLYTASIRANAAAAAKYSAA